MWRSLDDNEDAANGRERVMGKGARVVCIIVGNKLWFYIVEINDFVLLNLLITSKQICVYKPCLSFFYAISIEFLSDCRSEIV